MKNISLSTKKIILIIFVIFVAILTLTLTTNIFKTGDEEASRKNCKSTINVSVSIDQWSDFTKRVLGNCAIVTPVISNSTIDPHEFEPTAADINTLVSANFAVINGGEYDQWATDALENSGTHYFSFDSAGGSIEEENPHYWFAFPEYSNFATILHDRIVEYINNDSTGQFTELIPGFDASLQNYLNYNADFMSNFSSQLNDRTVGKSFVATESVANYFAAGIGLHNSTPEGYANSVANESEPAPQDVSEVLGTLSSGEVEYLFFNSQESDSVTDKIVAQATESKIKIIEVSETMPDSVDSLQNWMTQILGTILD